MISILILAGICLTADAKPNPVVGSYAVDGVQGVLYEVPEYEDPELALLQLSSMGVMPVLTVLHEADSLDGEDATCMEEFSDVKKSLDGIIGGLELARDKFEEGSTSIDKYIDKSITTLMKLKHHIQVHVNPTSPDEHGSSNSKGHKQESSFSETDKQESKLFKGDKHGLIPYEEKPLAQVSLTTASSDVKDDDHDISKFKTVGDAIMVSESSKQTLKSFLKFKHPPHASNDPIAPYESEAQEGDHDAESESKKISKQSTTSSYSSDSDDTDDDDDLVGEISKYKGKAIFRKKWSWKPSNDEE